MLAVQSLRNAQMTTILTAATAIIINLALAALTNNNYKASHLLSGSAFFGSQSGKLYVLKFGSASLFLLVSFLCSSMGLAFLIDANFLINAASREFSPSPTYTQTVFERGFMLALMGNRVLCITFPLLAWMFGPVPVALSSVALVWVLHGLDFPGKSICSEMYTWASGHLLKFFGIVQHQSQETKCSWNLTRTKTSEKTWNNTNTRAQIKSLMIREMCKGFLSMAITS